MEYALRLDCNLKFIFSITSLLPVLLLCSSLFANVDHCAEVDAVVSKIEYVGLVKTKPIILERQISLQAGDFLTCQSLEKARQAIQDLGLFKSVEATSQTTSAGLKVVFTVIEKRYLLVIPFVGSTESGSLNYGVRGNWSNIGGLNQKGRLNIRKKTFDSDIKESEEKAAISFSSPQIKGSDYDASIGFTYIDLETRAFDSPLNSEPFNEVFRYATIGLSRWYHQEQKQKGWQLGSALSARSWKSDNPALVGIQDADQSHLGIEFSAQYNLLYDRRYSFDGYVFNYRLEPSVSLRGERSPLTQEVFGSWHKPVGRRAHSEVELKAGLGWSNGAYEDFVPFQNLQIARLRGVSYDDFEGDRYYYLKSSYLTPFTFKPFRRSFLAAYPSLRAEFFAEVDDVYFQNGARNRKGLDWGVGAGIRWRVPWFVGVQLGSGLVYNSVDEKIGLYVSFR